MSKKQLIYGLVAFCVVLGFIVKRQVARKNLVPTKNTVAPINSVEVVKTPASEKQANPVYPAAKNLSTVTKFEKEPPTKVRSEQQGLCRYFNADKVPLLPLASYLHLARKKSSFLLLPSFHGSCFSDTSFEFRLVDFDPTFDTAFNYYAQIKLSLSQKNELPLDLRKVFLEKLDFKKYGFESVTETINYLKKIGYDMNSSLVEFKIQIDGNLKWPQSSSNPDFYPGLVFFPVTSLPTVLADKNNLFLATYDVSKDASFTYGRNFQFLNLSRQFNDFNLNPHRVIELLDKKLNPLIGNKNKVFIYQEYPGDPQALALITYLQAKFKSTKVFLVSENYADRNNYRSLTPTRVPGLGLFEEESLAQEERGLLFVDTRSISTGFDVIRNSVSAPVYNVSTNKKNYTDLTEYGLKLKFSNPVVDLEINQLRKRYPLDKLLKFAGNRKIVLYGKDDADYSPLVFFEAIKNEKLKKIFWLRLGTRRVSQLITLEALPESLLKEQFNLTETEYLNKADSGKKKKVQKYIVVRPRRTQAQSLEALLQRIPGTP